MTNMKDIRVGCKIVEDKHLTGTKYAYLFADDVILVSPAIMSLIKDFDESNKLEWLLARIPVKEISFAAHFSLTKME